MKKSEVKKLFLEFYEHQTSQNMRFTGDDFLYLAEHIIGMLPPSIPTNATGWEVGKGAPTHINEWENEDADET